MRRDMDLIRHLLLDIDGNEAINGRYVLTDREFGVEGEDLAKVQYHLRLLLDANYLEGRDGLSIEQMDINPPKSALDIPNAGDEGLFDMNNRILITRMTMAGHDYLETVRDNKVWDKTKKALNGGLGVGLDTIKDVAKEIGKQVINHQVKKHTGIDMGMGS